ncbi:MAG: hypothetical protein M3O28_00805 [Actinomycetota bacterium]|nr:hypothetical protein [Actinomycetota bacterium]
MTAITDFIKREPALVAMLVGIVSTLAASIPTGQGVLGGVVSGIIAILLTAVRQLVSPVAASSTPVAPKV